MAPGHVYCWSLMSEIRAAAAAPQNRHGSQCAGSFLSLCFHSGTFHCMFRRSHGHTAPVLFNTSIRYNNSDENPEITQMEVWEWSKHVDACPAGQEMRNNQTGVHTHLCCRQTGIHSNSVWSSETNKRPRPWVQLNTEWGMNFLCVWSVFPVERSEQLTVEINGMIVSVCALHLMMLCGWNGLDPSTGPQWDTWPLTEEVPSPQQEIAAFVFVQNCRLCDLSRLIRLYSCTYS